MVISIYDHPDPIAELQRCYRLHRLAYFPSEPANLVPITPELAVELKTLMAAQGFYTGEVDHRWDVAAQRQLDLFLGRENYDNRIDNGGLFDLEVLADLRLRYAEPDTVTSRTSVGGATISSLPPSPMACECCRAVVGAQQA